jgi:hypothetical protein
VDNGGKDVGQGPKAITSATEILTQLVVAANDVILVLVSRVGEEK